MKKSSKAIIFLIILWGLTHLPTLGWGLPANFEFTPDCIYPHLSLTAKERMAQDLFRYPPLQFLILDSMTSVSDEQAMDRMERQHRRTGRILFYRSVCALMLLGTMLIIYAAGRTLLDLPEYPSAGAAALFALTPCAVFYSHTSNLDIPYTFWAAAAFTSAVYAECKSTGTRYSRLNLLTGVMIACAFCTKDQAYGLFILPAFLLVFCRFRKHQNILHAFYPLLLWLCSFLPAVLLIYFSAGGWETMQKHFQFIFTDGRTPFYMVPQTFPGRLELFLKHLLEFSSGFDWPLLLLIILCTEILCLKKEFAFFRKNRLLLILFLLTFLSTHLTVNQATLSTYPRFMIPLIPFGALIAVKMVSCLSKTGKWILLPVLCCQTVVCADLLHNMMACPQKRLASDVRKLDAPVCTTSAVIAKVQGNVNGKFCEKILVRSWSFSEYDFTPAIIPDIPKMKFFTDLLEPEYLICSENFPDYEIDSVYETDYRFPSFFRYSPGTRCLLKRKPGTGHIQKPDPDFIRQSISTQLMLLSRALRCTAQLPEERLLYLGHSLTAFKQPDCTGYLILPQALETAEAAYRAAGRSQDARLCRAFILQSGSRAW